VPRERPSALERFVTPRQWFGGGWVYGKESRVGSPAMRPIPRPLLRFGGEGEKGFCACWRAAPPPAKTPDWEGSRAGPTEREVSHYREGPHCALGALDACRPGGEPRCALGALDACRPSGEPHCALGAAEGGRGKPLQPPLHRHGLPLEVLSATSARSSTPPPQVQPEGGVQAAAAARGGCSTRCRRR